MQPKPQQIDPDPYQLKCLEVWGGSSSADHNASVPGLDISVSSRPIEGSESGGDIYLISSCSSGWISRILLADVSGHGSAVSDLSSQLRNAMHKSINTVDQSKLARSLNKSFDQISSGSKFATALLMTYYAPSGHLILVNAGHPPPLICRAQTNQWIPLNKQTPGVLRETTSEVRIGIKNLPLGVIGSTQYEQIAIKINEGDRICAYTDAFSEAQHDNGSLLGSTGLAETLNNTEFGNASENASSVLTEIRSRGYKPADDDHTMLMLHHNGQSSPNIKIETVSNFIKNSFGLGHRDTVLS